MKIFKALLKIIKVIFIIFLVLILVIGLWYLWADNAQVIFKGYNEKIETGGKIEEQYLQNGIFETSKTTVKEAKPINKYTIYYPSELKSSDKSYPMVLIVNGTGGKATKYEPMLRQLASWGFIVVGTQDKGTGTGESSIITLNYMLSENANANSIFYGKIDIDNIGISGFSQGGAGTIRAITMFDESHYFKTAVPLSPVSEKTAAETTHYPYDSSKINCPILMLAGTSGEFETKIVIPIGEMNKMYEKISSPKVMARRIGMTHDDMLYKAQGYVTAWFMWQLQGDEIAREAFVGENAEILTNELYQDIKTNILLVPSNIMN